MCLEFALPCLGKPYNMHYSILFVPLHEHDAYTHDKYEVVQNGRKFSVNSLRETKYCEHNNFKTLNLACPSHNTTMSVVIQCPIRQ
jgi:hypothetical protein